jgi:hypothetical protein
MFGPRGWILVAWVRSQAIRGTAILVHENVSNFEILLLSLLVMDAYWIHSKLVGPVDIGMGAMGRTRRFTVLYLKSACEIVRPVWDTFEVLSGFLRDHCQTTADDLFMATLDEVAEEIIGACRTLGIAIQTCIDFRRNKIVDLEQLLTRDEHRRLQEYRQSWFGRFGFPSKACTWAIFNLSQNPTGNMSWSAYSFSAPCLTTKKERLWADYLGRWLTIRELQTAMGQFAYADTAEAAHVPVFSLSRMPESDARFVLGNSIHVGVIGVITASALASVVPRQPRLGKRRRLA